MRQITKSLLTIALVLICNIYVVAQERKDAFAWGVNGHPLTQADYRYETFDKQLNFLKDLQINYYRIDVPLVLTGWARNDRLLFDLLARLKKNGIKPMLVVFPKEDKMNGDSVSVYNYYFELGQTFAKRYGDYMDVTEVGNEWDLKMMKKDPRNDGTKASHYKSEGVENRMWLLAGFIEGMKSIKPGLKVSMSLTWTHWYYLDILQKYRIKYDIIGYHWYSNMGNITNVSKPYGDVLSKVHSKYKKEIWITEFNTYIGTKTSSFEDQEKYIYQSIKDIMAHGLVKGFFIYELFDEPSLTNYPKEMSYGLIYKEGLVYKPKPAYYAYKELIKLYNDSL